ncbi:MAG: hypothetical protein LC107_04340 [Chitinophagales bacterium]|nr:hypothetical protein [Chitinophagales bacterium]
MSNEFNKFKTYYRQRLPHIQPIGATFFVTFRLYGSIPYTQYKSLKDEFQHKILQAKKIKVIEQRNRALFQLRKEYLYQTDQLLHKIKSGPTYLADETIMEFTKATLHRFDNELYSLLCYCVMSNHVHLLIDTSIQIGENIYFDEQIEHFTTLDNIMKGIKGPISRFANQQLNRSGQFWARESYDIYIRNDKMLGNVMSYILENPVKAGIVDKWEEYPGSYLKV